MPHLQHSLHPHLSYLFMLQCCTPSLLSQVARRTTVCKSFHSVRTSLHFIFCNRFPDTRSGLFYLSLSNLSFILGKILS